MRTTTIRSLPYWITSDPDADGQTIQYVGPHWEVDEVEGERSWPVAYIRNSTMVVSAEFTFSPSFCAVSGSGEILVRAFGLDEIKVPARAVSLWGDYAILEETWVDTPFPNEVRHYDQFVLNWQASSNGGETWIDVGTSQNDLYLTWDVPLDYPLYHTVVHLGSTNGKNAADHDNEAEVLDAIWAEFSDLQVQTASGMPLWYYKDWTTTKSQAGMLLQSVGSGDDQHGDGTCDAWVDLFRTVLKAQGIDSGTAKTIRADNVMYSQPPLLLQEVEGFVIAQWNLTAANYGYVSESSGPIVATNLLPAFQAKATSVNMFDWQGFRQSDKYVWPSEAKPGATPGNLLPGQGLNANPVLDDFVSTCVAAVFVYAQTRFDESLVEHRNGTQGVDLNGNDNTQDIVWRNTLFFMINDPHDPTDRWLQNQFRVI
jgi:hypothetical protein